MFKDIDISLSLGQLIYGKKWIPVICLFLMAILFPILTLIMCCFSVDWNSRMIATLYIIIKDKQNKKHLKMWMQDAIKVEAYSKKCGEYKWIFLLKGIIIQVVFQVNGEKIVQNSTVKTFTGRVAYLASFIKYADRKINVLYSPKYNEVMILKD